MRKTCLQALFSEAVKHRDSVEAGGGRVGLVFKDQGDLTFLCPQRKTGEKGT